MCRTRRRIEHIAIDDNAVMHKFNRREYIDLELTEYYLLTRFERQI